MDHSVALICSYASPVSHDGRVNVMDQPQAFILYSSLCCSRYTVELVTALHYTDVINNLTAKIKNDNMENHNM